MLDPQISKVLEQLRALSPKPWHQMTPEELRQRAVQMRSKHPKERVSRILEITVPGPQKEISLRIYTPQGEKPLPVLVFFHGGGWVIGDLEMGDDWCRHIANGVGCVVVSADYRLAPENLFPAAVEDAFAAVRWVHIHAEDIGADRNRMAIGGESAGGNLAAAVALMARDRNAFPLTFQWLIYPVLDADFTRASYHENAHGHFIEKESLMWAWDQYVPNKEDRKNPYAAPLKAQSVKGLPPAFIATAEFDPLRDEGAAYAERLRKEGIPTRYHCFPGLIHGFLIWTREVDASAKAFQLLIDELSLGLKKNL